MRDALIEAIGAVYDHPDVRAVVLSAAGKHFSAGADISEFGGAEDIVERRRIRWDRDPWGPLWDIAVPVVAALHGYTLAAGLEMAMLCDLRLATVDTKLGLPETKLGMLPAAGGTQSLTKAIGPHVALPIVLTGREHRGRRGSASRHRRPHRRGFRCCGPRSRWPARPMRPPCPRRRQTGSSGRRRPPAPTRSTARTRPVDVDRPALTTSRSSTPRNRRQRGTESGWAA